MAAILGDLVPHCSFHSQYFSGLQPNIVITFEGEIMNDWQENKGATGVLGMIWIWICFLMYVLVIQV